MKFKNVVIQYKGGGYDGCFWEWNFCYFDDNGIFHDIVSSGWLGAPTVKKFNERFEEFEDDDYYVYGLDKPNEVKDFTDNALPEHVKGVARFLKYYGIELKVKCDVCGFDFPASTIEFDGYHGVGGIAVQMDGCLCSDCYYANVCDMCEEYCDPIKDPLVDFNGKRLCLNCAPILSSMIIFEAIEKTFIKLMQGWSHISLTAIAFEKNDWVQDFRDINIYDIEDGLDFKINDMEFTVIETDFDNWSITVAPINRLGNRNSYIPIDLKNFL